MVRPRQVVIHGDRWHEIARDFRDIAQNSQVSGEIRWRQFSPKNKDKDNPLAGLSHEARNQYRFEVLGLISRHEDLKLLSVVVNSLVAYEQQKVMDKTELYHYAYSQLTEGFQLYLQDLSQSAQSRACSIVVCDHRQNPDDSALRELHQRLILGDGSRGMKYDNLVEGLYLVPSHMSVGIQLADLVAGAVFRKFEHGDSRFFDAIESSFWHSRDGQEEQNGLTLWPEES